jgi:glycosyltransferase involved in cell wall biosynthesis
MTRRIALVIPWFGEDQYGGAEQQAWQLATRLSNRGVAITVLTTTSQSHQRFFSSRWNNNLKPGKSSQYGFDVIRFPVKHRRKRAFDKTNRALLGFEKKDFIPGVRLIDAAKEKRFFKNNINSPRLVAHIARHRDEYDAFLFLPYLYPPIIDGVKAAGKKAILQPCLHDECYAYLDAVQKMFHSVPFMMFNSAGEFETAVKIFGPSLWSKSLVAGEGIEIMPIDDKTTDSTRLIEGEYLLYLGKRDRPKNVDFLIRVFEEYIIQSKSRLKLVLAGSGPLPVVTPLKNTVDMGLVSDADKQNLLRHCRALVNPSKNESFSRIIYEAWFFGKPVIVHQDCPATSVALAASGYAGWQAKTRAAFMSVFETVEQTSSAQLEALGKRGRCYAEATASWDKVIDGYLSSFDRFCGEHEGRGMTAADFEIADIDQLYRRANRRKKLIRALIRRMHRYLPEFLYQNRLTSVMKTAWSRVDDALNASNSGTGPAIHQVLPNLDYGDAISNQAILLKRLLRSKGFQSEIFVRYFHYKVMHECKLFKPESIDPSALLIYHHSIGTDLTNFVLTHPAPKMLVYHNITPYEFYAPYDEKKAGILRRGRAEFSNLTNYFDLAVGDSEYNTAELVKFGFQKTQVMPICVEPSKWNFAPDRNTVLFMQGKKNILFVGRLAPNKKQNDLIRVFKHINEIDPNTRLWLVGQEQPGCLFARELKELIQGLGLQYSVFLTGAVEEAALHAFYKNADLFMSLSEHEGFCVPLIEAMWFDVPVLAYAGSAVSETMKESAFLITDKSDYEQVAKLACAALNEETLRQAMISHQRRNRERFRFENLRERYEDVITSLTAAAADPADKQPATRRSNRKPSGKPKVAFVVQRCGKEVNGGAELHCRQVAEKTAAVWNTEIITTCALDYMTWDNHYREGVENVNGVPIRRFKVDSPRNVARFDRFSREIHPRLQTVNRKKGEKWMRMQGPYSSELLNYLKENRDQYDRFIFFTYLYATSYFGLPLVKSKAILVPTAHDEWPIYLPMWNSWFQKPQKLLFNTNEERDFIFRRFPGLTVDADVVGIGIDLPQQASAERFLRKFEITDPYILYVGRIDESKGCKELIAFFQRYQKETQSRLKLVLIGNEIMTVPVDKNILSLGFVDEQSKYDAIAGCAFLVNPSPYESLSIVLLEAWSLDKPVLVNAKSEVMVGQCRRSQAGFWYNDYDEFKLKTTDLLQGHPEKTINARSFVEKHYSWPVIVDKYASLLVR